MDQQDILHREGERADEIFSVQPIGGWNEEIWFSRAELEREFSFLLGAKSRHICVDGPSGTGKTSLTQSLFYKHAEPYIAIQAYKGMTWAQFCRNFVEAPRTTKKSDGRATKGILSFFNPSAEVNFSYTREWSAKESFDLVSAMADRWTPDDVGRCLEMNAITLIVDDLEQASEELIQNISNLMKLMGQTYRGRVVAIGTDDVLIKLVNRNSAISSRVSELTVDGLPDSSESARFIMKKFKLLGIKTPYDRGSSFKGDTKDLTGYIYRAANGLLKELNELGLILSRNASAKRNLTPAAIKSVCEQVIKEKSFRMRPQCRALAAAISSSIESQEVVEFLAMQGASRATPVASIQYRFVREFDDEQIEEALELLESGGIITITGTERRKVFFRNPTMLNTVIANMDAERSLQHSLGLLGGKARGTPKLP